MVTPVDTGMLETATVSTVDEGVLDPVAAEAGAPLATGVSDAPEQPTPMTILATISAQIVPLRILAMAED